MAATGPEGKGRRPFGPISSRVIASLGFNAFTCSFSSSPQVLLTAFRVFLSQNIVCDFSSRIFDDNSIFQLHGFLLFSENIPEEGSKYSCAQESERKLVSLRSLRSSSLVVWKYLAGEQAEGSTVSRESRNSPSVAPLPRSFPLSVRRYAPSLLVPPPCLLF